MKILFSRTLLSCMWLSSVCISLVACSGFPNQAAETSQQQLEQRAEQGDAESQYSLGINYYTGQGVNRDLVVAREWFQKAAEQGQADAQYQLGEIYMKGQGVAKEPDWAARWYGKAAEQQYPEAQYALGIAFERGLGLPNNWVRACQWLLLAERSDHALAIEQQNRVCGQLSAEQGIRARQLADRWQKSETPFYTDPPSIRYIQIKLLQLRYYFGYVDGVDGEQTRSAIKRYLEDKEMSDKDISKQALLEHLRTE